ncbi:MAG: phage minor head protein [Desulfovibrionaceae bacterium]|nr:phage minor head protein [Desulfovibrionaceae bacterium]
MADRPDNKWKQPWAWADAAKARADDNAWGPSRAAEKSYERQLLNLAAQIERLIRSGGSPEEIERKLREYADTVGPWARQSAANMMAGVDRKNVQAWSSAAKRAGLDMRRLMHSPGVGEATRAAIERNAGLITSLVTGAADQVAEAVASNLAMGSRAEDLAKRLEGIGHVSASRARTIARTEVSKAGTALTMARAESVGSTGYIWRTARDGDTRASHRAMEGVFVKWTEPPTLDGMTGHAGEFPNCRCYPEPVIPREDDGGVYKPPLQTAAEARNSGQKTLYSQWERTEGSAVIPHVPGSPLVGVDRVEFDKYGKLTKYSLNPEHSRGKDKARVWRSSIGVTQEHADMIHDQVMAFLPYAEAVPEYRDGFGERFKVLVPVTGPNGKTVDVVTAWMYDTDKSTGRKISVRPRLISIFIPDDSHAR